MATTVAKKTSTSPLRVESPTTNPTPAQVKETAPLPVTTQKTLGGNNLLMSQPEQGQQNALVGSGAMAPVPEAPSATGLSKTSPESITSVDRVQMNQPTTPIAPKATAVTKTVAPVTELVSQEQPSVQDEDPVGVPSETRVDAPQVTMEDTGLLPKETELHGKLIDEDSMTGIDKSSYDYQAQKDRISRVNKLIAMDSNDIAQLLYNNKMLS